MALPTRQDRRLVHELRPTQIRRRVNKYAEGSSLIHCGNTQVLCTASVEDQVPPWLRGTGSGWVTAQYGMLPRATSTRSGREAYRGRQSGRTQEIQRLIGRSLRTGVNLKALGERTITVDCDVLQADGGTRTAAITAGWVALAEACHWLHSKAKLQANPLVSQVAAVSVGIHAGSAMLDLCYLEDKDASTDCNVVMNSNYEFIEVQGTAEGKPFSRAQLDSLLQLAEQGIRSLLKIQCECIDQPAS